MDSRSQPPSLFFNSCIVCNFLTSIFTIHFIKQFHRTRTPPRNSPFVFPRQSPSTPQRSRQQSIIPDHEPTQLSQPRSREQSVVSESQHSPPIPPRAREQSVISDYEPSELVSARSRQQSVVPNNEQLEPRIRQHSVFLNFDPSSLTQPRSREHSVASNIDPFQPIPPRAREQSVISDHEPSELVPRRSREQSVISDHEPSQLVPRRSREHSAVSNVEHLEPRVRQQSIFLNFEQRSRQPSATDIEDSQTRSRQQSVASNIDPSQLIPQRSREQSVVSDVEHPEPHVRQNSIFLNFEHPPISQPRSREPSVSEIEHYQPRSRQQSVVSESEHSQPRSRQHSIIADFQFPQPRSAQQAVALGHQPLQTNLLEQTITEDPTKEEQLDSFDEKNYQSDSSSSHDSPPVQPQRAFPLASSPKRRTSSVDHFDEKSHSRKSSSTNFSRPIQGPNDETALDIIQPARKVYFDDNWRIDGPKTQETREARIEKAGIYKYAPDPSIPASRRRSSCVMVNDRKSIYSIAEEKVVRAVGKKRLRWTRNVFIVFFLIINIACITISWTFPEYWYICKFSSSTAETVC